MINKFSINMNKFRVISILLLFLAIIIMAGCGNQQKFDPRIAGLHGKVLLTLENYSGNVQDADSTFSLLLSAEKAGDGKNEFVSKGDFNGFIAALLPEFIGQDCGIVFRDGTVFSAGKVDFKELTLIAEGRAGFEVITAAKIGGNLLAIGREKGSNWAIYNFSDSKWVVTEQELPIMEFSSFAIAEMAEYKGNMLLFWRGLVGEKIEPVLRMAYYEDDKWQMLPRLPADNELVTGFAITVTDESILLVQDAANTGGNRVGGMPLYEYYPQKGWSVLADVPFPANKMALRGYGIDIKRIGGGYAVARADELGVEVLYSTDIENGIWSKIPAGASAALQDNTFNTDSVWNYFLLALSAMLIFVFIKQNRRRKALARMRAKGENLSTGDLRFEKMVKAVRVSRIGGFASVFDRGVAIIIDGTLVAPVPYYYLNSSSDDFMNSVMASGQISVFFLWLGALSIYSFIAELAFGQTIGKALIRIRVRNLAGGRITPYQALLRNVARFIDFFPVPLGGARIWYLIAFISATVSKKRQRVGDLLGKTVVRRHTALSKRKIILASASPRRKELLTEYGLNFEVIAPAVSEHLGSGVSAKEGAKQLAVRKAEAIARRADDGELVIAADTIVALGEEMLGKPENPGHAYEILSSLSGNKHEVITGMCIIDTATGQLLSGYELTEVVFKELTESEIREYIESGEGEDKAGSYAVQGEGGDFVDKIYGSTSNVIGLPLELLKKMFNDLDA